MKHLEISSIDRYRNEWKAFLMMLDEKPDAIHEIALNSELKRSKFRSIYWALLLRVLNADHRTWRLQRRHQRQRYERFQHEFVKNPHDVNLLQDSKDNPLSQSSQSIWNQYFIDQELRALILQDVVRTFPGMEFFRKHFIQTAMCNLLFYYAREHPYMNYRQGMHEILAPIIFVMYNDHQSLLHFKDVCSEYTQIDETLLDVLDPNYLESDCYFVFRRLMSSIDSYYRVSDILSLRVHSNENLGRDNVKDKSQVIAQLAFIRDTILAEEDLHLHNYLLKMDIPLHIFGIRWLRLLFGREFALLDLLILWDAIFADVDRFDLPNYILVAMLIHIRDKLLLSDYSTCLTYLMHYPNNVDINLILRHALHMKMPKKYDQSPNAFVYLISSNQKLMNVKQIKHKERDSANLQLKQTNNNRFVLSNPGQILKSNFSMRFNCHLNGKSSTFLKNETNSKKLQMNNKALSSRMTLTDQTKENFKIMNNPQLLVLELENAQTTIRIAYDKLQEYLQILRKQLPIESNTHELNNTLDGITELCETLNITLNRTPICIDAAIEANENHQNEQQNMKLKSNKKNQISKNLNQLKSKQVSKGERDISMGTKYERPENSLIWQSNHLLANCKEIELQTIASHEMIVNTSTNNCNLHINKRLPNANPLNLTNSIYHTL